MTVLHKNCQFLGCCGLLTGEVEENLGISGSETVGVIVAIVGGATILIIVILLISMICRYRHHTIRSYNRKLGRDH